MCRTSSVVRTRHVHAAASLCRHGIELAPPAFHQRRHALEQGREARVVENARASLPLSEAIELRLRNDGEEGTAQVSQDASIASKGPQDVALLQQSDQLVAFAVLCLKNASGYDHGSLLGLNVVCQTAQALNTCAVFAAYGLIS